MKRVICKNKIDSLSGELKGLTLDKIYEVYDVNNIGYIIEDDLNRKMWYCKDKFLEKEDVREISLSLLLDENKIIKVIDIDDESVINCLMSDDVKNILLIENNLPSANITYIEKYTSYNYDVIIGGSFSTKCMWRVHYNFSNGIFMGGGYANIENLDMKIRDLKLDRLVNM